MTTELRQELEQVRTSYGKLTTSNLLTAASDQKLYPTLCALLDWRGPAVRRREQAESLIVTYINERLVLASEV